MEPLNPLKPLMPPEEKFTKSERAERGFIFVVAGLFIGIGVGYASDSFIPYVFIGLGLGFAVFAISLFFRK